MGKFFIKNKKEGRVFVVVADAGEDKDDHHYWIAGDILTSKIILVNENDLVESYVLVARKRRSP